MKEIFTVIRNNALLLGLFGLLGSVLVATTNSLTAERIARNERMVLIRQIDALIPPSSRDNEILTDTLTIHDPSLSREDVVVFRARNHGQPVGVLFSPVDAPGYSSVIRLIVAIHMDGTLGGVRVLSQQETPGLGDKIVIGRSNWITQFNGKSLHNPEGDGWAVKKDGGDFDQLTGATISPRAVVAAVKRSLDYYQQHKNQLFRPDQQKEANGE